MKRTWIACAALLLAAAGCRHDEAPEGIDFRQEMRTLVQEISAEARLQDPDFIVIPQNGAELLSTSGEAGGPLAADYVAAISGVSREDLFYGYDRDDKATPAEETAYMRGYLDMAQAAGLPVMVTDYCSDHTRMDDSYAQNDAAGYIGLAADRRDLDGLPAYPAQPHHVNADTIAQLSDIRNYLYFLQPGEIGSKQAFVDAIRGTDYDLVLTDLFFSETEAFSAADVEAMRQKANGGRRLVICYMSIGEAEDYRYYWDSDWKFGDPEWLRRENRRWKGNYKVWYWHPAWKAIVYGDGDSYLHRIIDAGFDGVFLDIIDGFDYFEGL